MMREKWSVNRARTALPALPVDDLDGGWVQMEVQMILNLTTNERPKQI